MISSANSDTSLKAPKHLCPEPERGDAVAISAPRDDRDESLGATAAGEGFDEPRLADSGWTDDEYHRRSRGACVREAGFESDKGRFPPDEVAAIARRGRGRLGPARRGGHWLPLLRIAHLRLDRARLDLDDLTREAVAPARHAADHFASAGVVDRAARLTHGAIQGGWRHDRVRPERVEQLGRSQHALSLAQKQHQEREGFGLNRNGLSRAPQLSGRLVQLEDPEAKDHRPAHGSTIRARSGGGADPTHRDAG